jgi:hypothetical protein
VPKHTTKRGGKVTVEEFGCGHYGCVMPTDDPEVVCKITSDAAEAVFVAAALSLGSFPEGIVKYFGVFELPGEHRKRKTFILWREAATSVGLRTDSDYDTYATNNLRRFLYLFKNCASAARDSLKNANDVAAMLASAKAQSDWAWEQSRKIDLNRDEGASAIDSFLSYIRGAGRVAFALTMCDVIAETMENTDGCELVGDALRHYLTEGILLADVHGGNVGKVKRTSGYIITDPGHAVGLEERWRAVSVPALP